MYSLIIVDYNSVSATIEYIKRCKKFLSKDGNQHIVVVENAILDNDLQQFVDTFGEYKKSYLEELNKEIYHFNYESLEIAFCKSGENLGYAKGNNLGAKIAKQLWNDPYLIISNNDLEFTEVFNLSVANIVFETYPNVAIIGPQVVTPTGEIQSPRKWQNIFQRLIVPIWINLLGIVLPKNVQDKLYKRFCDDVVYDKETGYCDWVSGCFMLVRSSHFEEVGMFDDFTFLYAEEMIIGRRMEKNNYATWFSKDLEVIHHHAQTTKNSISVHNTFKLNFVSCIHYFKNYTNTSKLLIKLTELNFGFYDFLFINWNKLKQIIKK